MANTSSQHFIEDKTITDANTAEQKYSTRTICAWFSVRNNHASADLYIKTSDTDDTANAMVIAAGATKTVESVYGQANSYDLSEYRFVSGTAGHSFTIEYKKA